MSGPWDDYAAPKPAAATASPASTAKPWEQYESASGGESPLSDEYVRASVAGDKQGWLAKNASSLGDILTGNELPAINPNDNTPATYVGNTENAGRQIVGGTGDVLSLVSALAKQVAGPAIAVQGMENFLGGNVKHQLTPDEQDAQLVPEGTAAPPLPTNVTMADVMRSGNPIAPIAKDLQKVGQPLPGEQLANPFGGVVTGDIGRMAPTLLAAYLSGGAGAASEPAAVAPSLLSRVTGNLVGGLPAAGVMTGVQAANPDPTKSDDQNMRDVAKSALANVLMSGVPGSVGNSVVERAGAGALIGGGLNEANAAFQDKPTTGASDASQGIVGALLGAMHSPDFQFAKDPHLADYVAANRPTIDPLANAPLQIGADIAPPAAETGPTAPAEPVAPTSAAPAAPFNAQLAETIFKADPRTALASLDHPTLVQVAKDAGFDVKPGEGPASIIGKIVSQPTDFIHSDVLPEYMAAITPAATPEPVSATPEAASAPPNVPSETVNAPSEPSSMASALAPDSRVAVDSSGTAFTPEQGASVLSDALAQHATGGEQLPAPVTTVDRYGNAKDSGTFLRQAKQAQADAELAAQTKAEKSTLGITPDIERTQAPKWDAAKVKAQDLQDKLDAKPDDELATQRDDDSPPWWLAGQHAEEEAARQRDGDAKFSFAGERAQTADRGALAQAQQMEAMGRDSVPDRNGVQPGSPEQTHVDTGWSKGADNKWRFEIDDSKASVNEPAIAEATGGKTVAIGDVLHHPELFGAYPDLAKVRVSVNPAMKSRAAYDPGNDRIVVSDPSKFDATGPTSLKASLLHEIQHAIQNREGFAHGGSAAALRGTPEFHQELVRLQRKSEAAEKETGNGWNSVGGASKEQLEDIAAYNAYRRLAGEVEARNVQTRVGMTAAERRATPPTETADVPAGRQVVRQTRPPLAHDEESPNVSAKDIAAAKQMSEALSDFTGKEVRIVPADRVPDAVRRALGAFDDAFGGHTTVFHNETPGAADFQGVTLRDGKRFVNADSDTPLLAVAGHEMVHDMRAERPDLYKELADEIEKQGDLDRYLTQLKKNASASGFDPESVSRTEAHEELVADAVGDAMVDPDFIERLAKNNPTLFAKVAAYFKTALDRILSKLKDIGSSKYVRDVQAFRDKLEDVLKRYAEEREGRTPSEPGDAAMSLPEAGSESPPISLSMVKDALRNRGLSDDAIAAMSKDELRTEQASMRMRSQPLPEQKVTGVKNATKEEERGMKGKAAVEHDLSTTNPEQYAAAKARFDADPLAGQMVAAKVIADKKSITPEDSILLSLDAMRIINARQLAYEQAEKAMASGDEATRVAALSMVRQLDGQMETNDIASRYSGVRAGQALQARKVMIQQDYSMARMVLRAKVAKGADLTDAERSRLEKAANDIAQRTKELDAREAAIRAKEREPRQTSTRQTARAKFDDLTAQLKKIAEKDQLKPGCVV